MSRSRPPPLEDALFEAGATKAHEHELQALVLRALRDGRTREAAARLDEHFAAQPAPSLALRALRARVEYVARDFVRAAERYAAVAEEADEMPSLRLNQALCLLRAEAFDEAFSVLWRLLARAQRRGDTLEPSTQRRLWGYLGMALERIGRPLDAETAYLAFGFEPAARRVRRKRLQFTLVHEPGAPRSAPRSSSSDESAVTRLPERPEVRRAHTPPEAHTPETPATDTTPPAHAKPAEPANGPANVEWADEPATAVTDLADAARTPPKAPHTPWGASVQPPARGARLTTPAPPAMPPLPAPLERPSVLPRPLLDTTLAALMVPEASAALTRHHSGLVRGLAMPEAPLVFDPRARYALSSELEDDQQPIVAADAHGFVRLRHGVLLLHPRREAESLQLLELGDDRLVLDERFVVAFDGRLHCQSEAAPWPLELLELSGTGAVVLGLPQPFLSYEVQAPQRFELVTAALVGWLGALQLERRGDDADPWRSELRVRGNGTLLFLPKPAPGR